jgi:3-hydroxybutyryl-CoA dehydrogenase
MPHDPNRPNALVAVIGAGAMGRGIAQVTATGGMTALVFDAMPGAAAKARDGILEVLSGLAAKGRMSAADVEGARERLKVIDTLAAAKEAQLVVEAVVENLEVKRKVFAELETIVAPDAILATNTSSIRIASIAAPLKHKARVAGMHFFNPVPLMKLVEIVAPPSTAPEVIEALKLYGKRMTRVPVVVKDGPGFLVNLGGRAYSTEGLKVVHDGAATPVQVDAVMRDACSFRMGPFELMDLTGMDVNFPASQVIYGGFFHDRRLATSPLHESLFAAGRFGRKTRGGHYDYDEKGAMMVPPGADAPVRGAALAAASLAEADAALADWCREQGVDVLAKDDGRSPILCAPVGEDCSAVAARTGADYRRLVGIDLVTGTAKRATVMAPPGADPACLDAVVALIAKGGAKVTAIKDSPGFIAQRINAMIANLGCEMAQIGTASPADIDTAMTLGLNYPRGPIALTDAMGAKTVHAILSRMQALTGDDRYRPSLWLRRRAALGLSAATPD